MNPSSPSWANEEYLFTGTASYFYSKMDYYNQAYLFLFLEMIYFVWKGAQICMHESISISNMSSVHFTIIGRKFETVEY